MSDTVTTRLSAEEAQQEFERVLDKVSEQGERVVVSRGGKDVAVVIPIQELPLVDEQLRRRFLERVKGIWQRSDLSEEEAQELAYSELRALRSAS